MSSQFKQIIIGDIHGRDMWAHILKKENDFDRVIFIGDYVDTHEDISGGQQLKNLQDIIAFKKQSDKEVILLIGNHDYQYWPGSPDIGMYSGFQRNMLPSFQNEFNANRKLFQMCFVDEYDNWYSHAGFTKTWIDGKIGDLDPFQINQVFEYSPKSFKFSDLDASGCGDSKYQSCIWVRPKSLFFDPIDKVQIVGHTTQKYIVKVENDDKLLGYLIDCISDNQYLVNVDGKFEDRNL